MQWKLLCTNSSTTEMSLRGLPICRREALEAEPLGVIPARIVVLFDHFCRLLSRMDGDGRKLLMFMAQKMASRTKGGRKAKK